ncbi:MAG TPA: PIN domain nuclease [Actinomycetota bacterium]
MILVDTSAWIDLIRRKESRAAGRLRELLRTDAPVAVTEPVVMELLSGCRTGRELAATRRRLLALGFLRVGGLDTWERASAVGRACRSAGEPVRNGFDCLIAAVAIRDGATLLHHDRDFEVIARHTELQLEPFGA